MKYKSGIGACVLIVLGAIFLLFNFGLLPHLFMKQWWPLILIFVGILLLVHRGKPEGSE